MTAKPPTSTAQGPPDGEGERNLATFDRLDYESWNKKDVPLFREIHADDVLVHYPDGSTTKGIDEHVEWANGFWSAFDSEISAHPIKLAHGDWTSVVGDISITFARPLKTPDGKTISPTKKTWKGQMCTVARWKDGRIAEEILFWDNLDVMKTVGAL